MSGPPHAACPAVGRRLLDVPSWATLLLIRRSCAPMRVYARRRGPGLRPEVLLAACSAARIAVRAYSPVRCCLALPLLVPRVRADDHDAAMPADDPALTTDLLHTRLDLHDVFSLVLKSALSGGPPTCIGRRSGRDSGRTGSARRPPGRRAGSGC